MTVEAAIATTADRRDVQDATAVPKARVALAALALFIGLSAANAMGGVLQLAFFGLCLAVLVLHRHRTPFAVMFGVLLCGTIATLASLRGDAGIAPLARFARPFLEGYLLGGFLWFGCRVRTLQSVLMALAGYIMIELFTGLAMGLMPGVRTGLINSWYGDDTYDGQAFQAALLFRGFGVSRHHLFGFPLALGLIGAMLLDGASKEPRPVPRRLLTATALAALLLILPNARIGLLPLVLYYGLGVTLFFRFYYVRQLLALVAVGLPLLLLLLLYLGEAGEVLVAWMLEGAMQFVDPSQASDVTTVSDLNSMIFLPTDPLTWLIGEGRVCQPGDDCYSDIGWIRLLQEGGLVLTLPVAHLYFGLIVRIHTGLGRLDVSRLLQRMRPSGNLMLWVFLLTFCLAMIKGDAYAPNDYSRLIMALAVLVHQLPVRRRP